MTKKKKSKSMKILMVMAHPDDEVIFGWPILQDKSIDKEILICSSDENNPERQWCKHRKDALKELCDLLNIKFRYLPYNSEFYRTETRNEGLSKIIQHVTDEINKSEFDYIYTHNVLGEYGHLDHQLVHQIVMQTGHPVIISNMFIQSNWCPYKEISKNYRMIYNWQPIQKCINNLIFYLQCQSIYMKHKVWTWNKPPIPECLIYRIKIKDEKKHSNSIKNKK